MTLTASQTLITVLAVALGCMITRFAPFVIFPDSKEPPEVVTWLGKVLPAAMMGLLWSTPSRGFPWSARPMASRNSWRSW